MFLARAYLFYLNKWRGVIGLYIMLDQPSSFLEVSNLMLRCKINLLLLLKLCSCHIIKSMLIFMLSRSLIC